MPKNLMTFLLATIAFTNANAGESIFNKYYDTSKLQITKGKIGETYQNGNLDATSKDKSIYSANVAGDKYRFEIKNDEKFGESSATRITEATYHDADSRGFDARSTTFYNSGKNLRASTRCTSTMGSTNSIQCVTATSKMCKGLLDAAGKRKNPAQSAANLNDLKKCTQMIGDYAIIASSAGKYLRDDKDYSAVVDDDINAVKEQLKLTDSKQAKGINVKGLKFTGMFEKTFGEVQEKAKATQEGTEDFAALERLIDLCRTSYGDFQTADNSGSSSSSASKASTK